MIPSSLTAFVNDSLSHKVAVYDDLGAPFILSDAKIEDATLVIGSTPFSGTFKEESNLIDFFIPCELEQFNKAALLPFYVRIAAPGERSASPSLTAPSTSFSQHPHSCLTSIVEQHADAANS
jgi:hypothetical protein